MHRGHAVAWVSAGRGSSRPLCGHAGQAGCAHRLAARVRESPVANVGSRCPSEHNPQEPAQGSARARSGAGVWSFYSLKTHLELWLSLYTEDTTLGARAGAHSCAPPHAHTPRRGVGTGAARRPDRTALIAEGGFQPRVFADASTPALLSLGDPRSSKTETNYRKVAGYRDRMPVFSQRETCDPSTG